MKRGHIEVYMVRIWYAGPNHDYKNLDSAKKMHIKVSQSDDQI